MNLPLQPTTTPVAAGVAPVIAAGDAAHATGSDLAALSFAASPTLAVADARHASSGTVAEVFVRYPVGAKNAAHVMRAMSAALTQQFLLAPADAAHVLRSGNVAGPLPPPGVGKVTRIGREARTLVALRGGSELAPAR